MMDDAYDTIYMYIIKYSLYSWYSWPLLAVLSISMWNLQKKIKCTMVCAQNYLGWSSKEFTSEYKNMKLVSAFCVISNSELISCFANRTFVHICTWMINLICGLMRRKQVKFSTDVIIPKHITFHRHMFIETFKSQLNRFESMVYFPCVRIAYTLWCCTFFFK